MQLKIQILDHGHGLPTYASNGAAGLDLVAAIPETLTIPPGEWRPVPTGIAIALPPSHEAQVRPRSGLAAKRGLTVLNSPGTVDPDYRREVKVLLRNAHPAAEQTVAPGERIAQLVVAPVMRPEPVAVASLDTTERGGGGFGSTGT